MPRFPTPMWAVRIRSLAPSLRWKAGAPIATAPLRNLRRDEYCFVLSAIAPPPKQSSQSQRSRRHSRPYSPQKQTSRSQSIVGNQEHFPIDENHCEFPVAGSALAALTVGRNLLPAKFPTGTVVSLAFSQRSNQLATQRGRAPVSFDMPHNEFCSFAMRDEWSLLRIIHSIRQIPN